MSWQAIVELMEMTGGDIDKIEPVKMERACRKIESGSRGAGPAGVQKMLARQMYKRLCRNKQKKWEFG
jgi:hypothetical protein